MMTQKRIYFLGLILITTLFVFCKKEKRNEDSNQAISGKEKIVKDLYFNSVEVSKKVEELSKVVNELKEAGNNQEKIVAIEKRANPILKTIEGFAARMKNEEELAKLDKAIDKIMEKLERAPAKESRVE